MNPARPFQRSYWAIPGQLIGGCFPGDRDAALMNEKLDGLVQAGVTLVVNLMEEGETNSFGQPFVDYGPVLERLSAAQGRTIRRARFPIRDMWIPSRPEMRATLDAIEKEINGGGIVYVHCWGGRGRTGTVVGCCLLELGVATPDTVLSHLVTLTNHAPEFFQPTPQTPQQREFVTSWLAKQEASA